MDYEGLESAFGSPAEEEGGNQVENHGRTNQAEDIETLEDGRVVLKADDYKKLKEGVMNRDDYTRNIQMLQLSKQQLESQITAINDAVRDGRLTVSQGQKQAAKVENQLDQVEAGDIPPELQQEIYGLKEQLAAMSLRTETEELKKAHPNLDDAGFDKVVAFATQFTQQTRYPISLEQAYYMVHGKNFETQLAEVQKKDQQRKAKWTGVGNNPGYTPKKPMSVNSLEEAREYADAIIKNEMQRMGD